MGAYYHTGKPSGNQFKNTNNHDVKTCLTAESKCNFIDTDLSGRLEENAQEFLLMGKRFLFGFGCFTDPKGIRSGGKVRLFF